jgi:hypothetical protein
VIVERQNGGRYAYECSSYGANKGDLFTCEVQLSASISLYTSANYSTYSHCPISVTPLLSPKTLSTKKDLVQVMMDAFIRVTGKTLFEIVIRKGCPHVKGQKESIGDTDTKVGSGSIRPGLQWVVLLIF